MVRWYWVNSSAGASYNLDNSRARAYCACSRCGWGLFGHFYSHLSFALLSPSLWETARYRLKYCLKGSLNPNQPTKYQWGGRVVRRCWVIFQWRGVLLIWIFVGQGPVALAVGAGRGGLNIFLSSVLSLLFLFLFGRRPDID